MVEIKANFWDIYNEYDAICCTTNGVVNKKGRLVMGAGIALEFRIRWSELALFWGGLTLQYGQPGVWFGQTDAAMCVSFPTKYHWKDKSSIILIKKSAKELVKITNTMKWEKVLLPRFGCGRGGLDWQFVKNEITPILKDERFYVCHI